MCVRNVFRLDNTVTFILPGHKKEKKRKENASQYSLIESGEESIEWPTHLCILT